ncbi:hypothetical protein Z043_123085, partial [Scleropages formosus]
SCELTLDPNTANTHLYLSKDKRKVTRRRQEQSYPDHPDRFEYFKQVLCAESLSGIRRKGDNDDCVLGENDMSWNLICSGEMYCVRYNNKHTTIPIPPSNRVGVYVDWVSGTLSFYRVSSYELTLLYRFTSTFKEPLCPAIPPVNWRHSMWTMVESAGSDQGSSNVNSCQLTLDPNTANTHLCLSEDNRMAPRKREELSYPGHPDRFDDLEQVVCAESLSDRCYWEVQWSGEGADIGVTYTGIERKGNTAECRLGHNDKSWVLICSGKNYFVRHSNGQTFIPVHPSPREGVYLNWVDGTLSFYRVSSGELTLLHRFMSTFTEPLFPGFYIFVDSSVSLCELG